MRDIIDTLNCNSLSLCRENICICWYLHISEVRNQDSTSSQGTDHSGKQRLTVWDVAALRCPGPQWHQCTKLEISDMSGLPTLTAWLCFRAYHWLASPPCFARPWPFGVIPKSFGTFSWNRELPAHSPDRVMYCFLVCCLHGAHGPLGIC